MTQKLIDALVRADRLLIAAAAVVAITAGAALAYNPPTDKTVPTSGPAASIAVAASTPVTVVPEPRPLPAGEVRVIAAPGSDAVAAVARVVENVQTQCLAQAMYYEARGEGVQGEKAVADVIFNRMKSRYYPHTICGVVFQGAGIEGGCQFSFACASDAHIARKGYSWVRARVLAGAIVSGVIKLNDLTGGATSFHAAYIDPEWNDNMERTVQIGNQIFYRRAGRHSLSRGA